MPAELLSHPDRPLRRHLAEVNQAADLILGRHSTTVFQSAGVNPSQVLHQLSGWHDVAKATAFFQDYIVDTDDFDRRACRGEANPKLKTHTPLGALLAMRRFGNWTDCGELPPPLFALMIGLAVRGHHSRMPTLEMMQQTIADADLLQCQLSALSPEVEQCHPALKEALGPLLDEGLDDICFAAEDALIEVEDQFKRQLPLADRVRFRLAVQFCFSVLLEADKALLIHESVADYLGEPGKPLPATVVEDHPPTPRPGEDPSSDINRKRRDAFAEVVADAEACGLADTRPRLLTLPTGMGKTRCAAGWAFHLRRRIEEATGVRPKVLLVLPFLSVIEQTAGVYRSELLDLDNEHCNDPTLQTSHSLSARDRQDIEDPAEAEFALDTWRSDIVLTTFDQFLLSLMGDRTRYQQRFHNLCDALVVLDEVQGFPCHLWHPVATLMQGMAEAGRTRFLLMTATQPALLERGRCVEMIERPTRYARSRYRMTFDLAARRLSEWQEAVREEIAADSDQKWLLILNTRRSAQETYCYLRDNPPRKDDKLFLLSSDIVPLDRLKRIDQIKKSDRCIAVATQCVEAGVDLDMDRVVRDLAPLDSLIQAAGRCNRNALRSRATVQVVHLLDEAEGGTLRSAFYDYIYDPILMQETRSAVAPFKKDGLDEEQVTEVVEAYFAALVEKKALGRDVTDRWSRFDHEDINPSRLLRGDQQQISFIVPRCDQSGTLRERIKAAWNEPDRWKRRRELRRLAPEAARITISAWKTPQYRPGDVADPFPAEAAEPSFWFLHDDAYDEEIGFCPKQAPSSAFL